uniref:Uncharacterized protein n=1 Tax=Zea mays TaxID=4577 RepID=B7ZYE6_MAIZE|nr:unknown [Zea mays]
MFKSFMLEMKFICFRRGNEFISNCFRRQWQNTVHRCLRKTSGPQIQTLVLQIHCMLKDFWSGSSRLQGKKAKKLIS